jgi:hypothetical protein
MSALKTAFHTLPPLLRIPDELLVKVALLVVADNRRCTIKLTAICHRLRVVYIGAPELWNHVDGSWPSRIRQLFLDRAGSYSLALILSGYTIGDKTMLQCFIQASELRLQITANRGPRPQANGGQSIMECLEDHDLTKLRSLSVQINIEAPTPLLANFLKPASCANLTVFELLGSRVSSLPHLPALHRLVLARISVSFSEFHRFLSSTPSIERLDVSWLVFSPKTTPEPGDVPQIHLPALQHLSIKNVRETALVVSMLSSPQSSIHISIPEFGRDCATRSNHNTIMKDLARFWTARRGDACRLPTARMDRRVKDRARLIGTHIVFSDSSLFYSRPVISGEPDDPVWSEVTTVCLDYTVHTLEHQGRDLVAQDQDIDLRLLRRVDAVVIVGADFDPEEADEAPMRSLEDWLVSRHDDGRPFHSVEFRHCGGAARMLFERLEAGGVAHTMVWEP